MITSSDHGWDSGYNIYLLALAGSDCASEPIITAENTVSNSNFEVAIDLTDSSKLSVTLPSDLNGFIPDASYGYRYTV